MQCCQNIRRLAVSDIESPCRGRICKNFTYYHGDRQAVWMEGGEGEIWQGWVGIAVL